MARTLVRVTQNEKELNGKLLAGKDNSERCREFFLFLAQAMKEDVKVMLKRANFFSGLSDGSQARKTGAEKELVYVKLVVNGSPVELVLRCQHMADFFGEDAQAVKNAFDNAFLTTFEVPEDRFENLLVAACTDGASVNMGRLSGACTKMKEERPWMLIIHCSNHQLELAVKDAFTAQKSFTDIDELLIQIYYMFRNSGKAKRLFTAMALTLDVTCVAFVKAGGTRFQNHKYRAAKAMIINFLPLLLYLENMIEVKNAQTPKLKGYLNTFLSYKCLASLHFYKKVLHETAHLSYLLQTPNMLVTDVIDAISDTKDKLEDIAKSDIDLPFESEEGDDGSVILNAKATNLPASLSFKEKHKLTENQRRKLDKYTQVVHQTFELKRVAQGKQTVKGIKEKLMPAIMTCISQRFQPFLDEQSIFNSLRLIDHTCWAYDEKNFGVDYIRDLAIHFQVPLAFHGFQVEKAIFEFREMKRVAGQKYRAFKNKIGFWKTIFTNHRESFPHILLLVELCLCISISSATVERGFSVARRILTDSRLSLKKGAINELMMLRINVPVLLSLDPYYKNKLVNKAIDLYLDSQRYHRTKSSVSTSSTGSGDSGSLDSYLPTPFSS